MEAEFMCKCGEYVDELVPCDFCGGYHCFNCYVEAGKIGGGLNVRNTGWNCCTDCAEIPKVQIKILQEAKRLADGLVVLADKQHRKRVNQLAGIIDDINQAMKKIENAKAEV